MAKPLIAGFNGSFASYRAASGFTSLEQAGSEELLALDLELLGRDGFSRGLLDSGKDVWLADSPKKFGAVGLNHAFMSG